MHDEKDELKNRAVAHYEAEGEIAALTPAQLGNMLIENTPLLDTDDVVLFRNVTATLLDELPPQSILDQIDAIDFAYNMALENRCRGAIATKHEQEKHTSTRMYNPKIKKELRGESISGPSALETWHKLLKLGEIYGRNRRAIGKEWRARAENRKRPASSPALPIAVDQSPPLAPDREQMDGEVNQDGN
jgi:hypothetical protein